MDNKLLIQHGLFYHILDSGLVCGTVIILTNILLQGQRYKTWSESDLASTLNQVYSAILKDDCCS